MSAEYFLPFDTEKNSVRISQGRNGPWSHFIHRNGQHSTNAVDFALPLGTSILAMRAGVVFAIIDDSEDHYDGTDQGIGLSRRPGTTNLVAIEHDDGTLAYYLHFGCKDIFVKQSQRVRQGDIIGLTGESGWIGPVPHIHIQVNEGKSQKSLPITFENYDGSLEHDEIYPLSERERTRI